MGKHYMKSAMEHEIEARLSAATPGEWMVEEWTDKNGDKHLHVRQPHGAPQYGICRIFGEPDGEDAHVRADAEFIAHAKQDIQVLINIIAALRDELQERDSADTDNLDTIRTLAAEVAKSRKSR